MALKTCPNCGKLISDKAEQCPKCGTENPFEAEEAQTPIFAPEEKVTSQVEPTEAADHAEPVDKPERSESYCPECGHSLNGYESSCPKCGCLLEWGQPSSEDPERSGRGMKWLIALVVIVLMGGVGYYLFDRSNTDVATNRILEEDKRQQAEERERLLSEGPDWLQGSWYIELVDDEGSLGDMYSTFNHGTLTIDAGGMTFYYTYRLSDDMRSVELNNGRYYLDGVMHSLKDSLLYLEDECVITQNGQRMKKVS